MKPHIKIHVRDSDRHKFTITMMGAQMRVSVSQLVELYGGMDAVWGEVCGQVDDLSQLMAHEPGLFLTH